MLACENDVEDGHGGIIMYAFCFILVKSKGNFLEYLSVIIACHFLKNWSGTLAVSIPRGIIHDKRDIFLASKTEGFMDLPMVKIVQPRILCKEWLRF